MPTATSGRTKGMPRRERILNYLASQGGRVDSVDGRGLTFKMATRVGYDNIAALNAILARLERDGEIVREVRGKRTYSIALKRRASRARANGAKPATRPHSRRVARPGSAGGRRRPSASRPSVRGASVRGRAGAGSSPGSNLPQLFAALGNELVALRKQNEEMSRRLAALEVAARPAARRANGRRAA